MADAYVIHVGEQTAGIVVRAQEGFHFFASLPALFALEGLLFSGVGELYRMIDAIQKAGRSHQRDSVRSRWGRRPHEVVRPAA